MAKHSNSFPTDVITAINEAIEQEEIAWKNISDKDAITRMEAHRARYQYAIGEIERRSIRKIEIHADATAEAKSARYRTQNERASRPKDKVGRAKNKLMKSIMDLFSLSESDAEEYIKKHALNKKL